MKKAIITVAKGDGIGPEIMDATLRVLFAAGAELETEEIEVGEKVYLSGNTSKFIINSVDHNYTENGLSTSISCRSL